MNMSPQDLLNRSILMAIEKLEAKKKVKAEALAAAPTRTAKAVTGFLLAAKEWRESLPMVAYREDGTRCFAVARNHEERVRYPLWKRGPKTAKRARVPGSREQFIAQGWLPVEPSEEWPGRLLDGGALSLAHATHELAIAARRERVSATAALRLEFELQREPAEPDAILLDLHRDALLRAVELSLDSSGKNHAAEPDAGGKSAKPRKKKGKVENALAVLAKHPDWSDTKIAETAGVCRTSLYGMKIFSKARKAQRRGHAGRRPGRHDGREAIDDRRPGNIEE